MSCRTNSRGNDAPWKDKIIEVQEEMIQKFKQENEELRQKIKEWEEWKASSKDRHAKGRDKTKKPKTKKPKVGFLRKRKPKKWYNESLGNCVGT